MRLICKKISLVYLALDEYTMSCTANPAQQSKLHHKSCTTDYALQILHYKVNPQMLISIKPLAAMYLSVDDIIIGFMTASKFYNFIYGND